MNIIKKREYAEGELKMKVKDLLRRVDQAAPFHLAQEWDNVGLMVGDLEADVSRVGVALDATAQAVREAAELGCQALLAHHPLLFRPVRKLDLGAALGSVIREAVRRDVAVLAAHTNWDCAAGGVNGTLARLAGLLDPSPLDVNTGLGAKGLLAGPLPLMDFLELVKRAWNLTRLDCYGGEEGRTVQRVALCGGAGADLWPAARAWGVELYLTADMKYHELMDANDAGLPVALADHGEMERVSLPELARRVASGGGLEAVLLGARGLAAPIRL